MFGKLFGYIKIAGAGLRVVKLWSSKSADQSAWGQALHDLIQGLINIGVLRAGSSLAEKYIKPVVISSAAHPAMDSVATKGGPVRTGSLKPFCADCAKKVVGNPARLNPRSSGTKG